MFLNIYICVFLVVELFYSRGFYENIHWRNSSGVQIRVHLASRHHLGSRCLVPEGGFPGVSLLRRGAHLPYSAWLARWPMLEDLVLLDVLAWH